jgi:FG-GAP-like repeat
MSRRPANGRFSATAVLALALCAVAVAMVAQHSAVSVAMALPQSPAPAAPDLEQQARAACATCHVLPPPEILPRSQWRDEFVRMKFIREQKPAPVGARDMIRLIPLPDDFEKALPYYTSRAPEHLPSPEPWPDPGESPIRFAKHSLSVPQFSAAPAVSNVRLVDFDGDGQLDLLATEMQNGLLLRASKIRAASELSILASIPHPDHVTPVDLDKDGIQDLLIADLGEFFPADHNHGAVIWMRGQADGKFAPMWLDGWPRVADVEAADFNDDGRLDLVVAAFGYHTTGQIAILENATTNYAQPSFTTHVIDPRTGSIHVIPVDLNHDGHMDFVALLAQEHETVIAYLNKGTKDFTFDQKVIYAAPHPNWGSSGIQLVDIDKDGDLDVLLTHGDTFDDGIVKPYHGIQWLENTASYPFVNHDLATLPGVHRALAVDIDGDSDLDVVATALLAGGADVDESTLPALVWLEQTKPGTFVKHTIEVGFPRHATIDAADIDGDGDVDLVVGNFAANRAVASWIDVWENQRKRPEISLCLRDLCASVLL